MREWLGYLAVAGVQGVSAFCLMAGALSGAPLAYGGQFPSFPLDWIKITQATPAESPEALARRETVLHFLLPEIALHLDPAAKVRLACCNRRSCSQVLGDQASVFYQRLHGREGWAEAKEFTYCDFLARNDRTPLAKVPYLSNALQLQFADGDELWHFLNSPDARTFDKIAIRFRLPPDLQRLSAGTWQLIRGLAPHVRAMKMDFDSIGLGDAVMPELAATLTHPESFLIGLRLLTNGLSDAGVALLAAALKHPHNRLTSLNLGDPGLSDASASQLAEVLGHKNNHLTAFNFFSPDLTDVGGLAIVQTLQNNYNHLTDFQFGGLNLTDEVAQTVLQAMRARVARFTALRLWSDRYSEAVAIEVADFLTLPGNHLQKLSLGGQGLGLVGATRMAQALGHPQSRVKRFEWAYAPLGLNELTAFANVLRQPEQPLVSFSLLGSETLDVAAITVLAPAVAAAARLSSLNLEACLLGDPGARILAAALRKNPQSALRFCNLRRNGMTLQVQAELKAAAPRCQFLF